MKASDEAKAIAIIQSKLAKLDQSSATRVAKYVADLYADGLAPMLDLADEVFGPGTRPKADPVQETASLLAVSRHLDRIPAAGAARVTRYLASSYAAQAAAERLSPLEAQSAAALEAEPDPPVDGVPFVDPVIEPTQLEAACLAN